MELTVQQEHLLKRELVRQQVSFESAAADNMINIDRLGAPFVLRDGTFASGEELPLFSFVLKNFIVTFPLLKSAKPAFWTNSAQPFIQGLASKDISSSTDRDEATKRRRLGRVAKRMILIVYVAGLGQNRPKPQHTRDTNSSEEVDSNMEDVADDEEQASSAEDASEDGTASNVLPPKPTDIYPGPYCSVIGVREGVRTGGLFKTKRSEYLLESCFWGSKPKWVARSWNDFVELHKALTRLFPGRPLPKFPHKTLVDTVTGVGGNGEVTLLREPQRLTLRNYVKKMCLLPKIANSEPFLDFLFKKPITQLTPKEIQDIETRIALDRAREQDAEIFRNLAAEREQHLDNTIKEIKKNILLEDALPELFLELKTHDKVEDMSKPLKEVVDLVTVELASGIYSILLARDDSPEILSQVKRLHGLVPYRIVQGILKLSNPALILKKLTDLFMATPFGGKSLLQTMMIRVLAEDVNSSKRLQAEMQSRLDQPEIVNALNAYTLMDHWSREALATTAQQDNIDLAWAILRDSSELATPMKKKVLEWHKQWQGAVNGALPEDTLGVENYSLIKDLLKVKVRQRDKDILQEFWADPATIQFVRDIVNLLYDVLIDVFRYANISDCVGDLERFLTELISFVEQENELFTPAQVVDGLIAVLRKHQNSVFKFIHQMCQRDDGIFVEIGSWLTLIVNFVKNGKAGKQDLDILGLPSKNVDIAKVCAELDELQAWLDHRRSTLPNKHGKSTIGSEEFPVAPSSLDVSDVGLNLDDVDFGLAEMERDNYEEFVDEMWFDLSQDAVTRAREQRYRQALNETRISELKQRPEMRETAKLLPAFSKEVFRVLQRTELVVTPLSAPSLKT